MAPLKFEEHIKEKLDKREIQPSARAWYEISSTLHTTTKIQQRNFLWYGIAAGFAGLLILSLVFLNSNDSMEITDAPVSDIDINLQHQPLPSLNEESPVNDVIVNSNTNQVEKKLPSYQPDLERGFKPKSEEIHAISVVDSSVDPEKEALWKADEEIIDAKIADLVAQAEIMQQENYTVTDSEVDSMLRKAQREILMEKYLKESHSVDATALLLDVEDELEQSFRDQLFETLKSGFLKVRTAVADRNK